jgi:hypothetical protein
MKRHIDAKNRWGDSARVSRNGGESYILHRTTRSLHRSRELVGGAAHARRV